MKSFFLKSTKNTIKNSLYHNKLQYEIKILLNYSSYKPFTTNTTETTNTTNTNSTNTTNTKYISTPKQPYISNHKRNLFGIRDSYQKEIKQYNTEMISVKKSMTKLFWEDQTKIENQYISEMRTKAEQTYFNRQVKDRNIMISHSYECYKQIQDEIERQQRWLAKQKVWKIQKLEEKEEKNDFLYLLDRQSEDWLTPENIDFKLNKVMENIVPTNILSHKDYYYKLNKQAILIDQGMHEQAEVLKREGEDISTKNKFLDPLYKQLKSMIKEMTYTNTHDIYYEYKDLVLKIKTKFGDENNSETSKKVLQDITNKYKELLTKTRLYNENPVYKFELLENNIKNILNIVVAWNRYIDILYLNNQEILELTNREKDNSLEFLPEDSLTSPFEYTMDKNFYLRKLTDVGDSKYL